MRHSTITLTIDTYGHLRPGATADAVLKFDTNAIELPKTGTSDTSGTPAACPIFAQNGVRHPAREVRDRATELTGCRNHQPTDTIGVSGVIPGDSGVTTPPWPSGGIGRRTGLKIPYRVTGVRVRPPPRPLGRDSTHAGAVCPNFTRLHACSRVPGSSHLCVDKECLPPVNCTSRPFYPITGVAHLR